MISIGTDILEIERIEQTLARLGDRFVKRILTTAEQLEYHASSNGARLLAKRFAGKEAVAKALQSLLPVAEAPQTPLAELLASAQVSPFAEFSTSRSKWTMGSASIDAASSL